ncbi:hypothetical protein UA75_31185 (plasmid) [Actinoalloteichus sp. GBA129-24]|nr:hypothetical protein UA75_14705 [Actinoalloteichus sp. GBA129-24]APU24200.1 hypothetical protein UA75_31185 [Actinoalloteichus sp. GBA129-24]
MQGAPNEVLDLDEWFSKRKLNDRRLKIGGRSFRFRAVYSADEVIEVDQIMRKGDLLGLLTYSLLDRDRAEDLHAAYREPAELETNRQFKNAVVEHLLKGIDLGESEASSPGSSAPAGTPASQDSADTTDSTSGTA